MDNTQIPPSGTAVPPSGTAVPPSGTAVPPSGTAVPPSGTAVPPSGTAVPPSGTAVPPMGAGAATGGDDTASFRQFDINGVQYQVVKILSDTSGEAVMYHVSAGGNDYALKLYRLHRHPDHEVLKAIHGMPRGNGYVVDVLDYGVWTSPAGRRHDFEVMPLYTGGSLSDLRPLSKEKDGNERLKEIALRMAASIDFCHRHHVLHRDVKPANFMYADAGKTSLVLTDFGIAKVIGYDGKATGDIGRTPIYAAPEVYISQVKDAPNYATSASDFYAMGMTLLALWMGEGVLTANERKLLDDKIEEELPYPSDMSQENLSLVRALTRRKESKRPTFEDIMKWAKGEPIFVEKKEFRVKFSDTQIANSPEELAKILWENKTKAIQYLYNDVVGLWLVNIEQNELSNSIKEITKRYSRPDTHEAGLYATCMLLDPSLPYYGKQGNAIETAEEIAEELTLHEDAYAQELTSDTHLLWLYMRAHDSAKVADDYVNIIRRSGDRGVRQLSYLLDDRLPYRVDLGIAFTSCPESVYSVDELKDMLAQGKFDDPTTVLTGGHDGTVIGNLAKDDFLVWLAGKDAALAGAARQAVNDCPNGATGDERGWRVAYAISPDRGYDFKPLQGNDASQLGTITQIANYMAQEINGKDLIHYDDLTAQMDADRFHTSHLYYYLQMRKKYDKQISWIDYCMDIDSTDNQHKAGPYNPNIARMKAVAGLLDGNFPLTVGGITVSTLADYEKNRDKVNAAATGLKDSMQLRDWLALQFQEKPGENLSGGNYTRKTLEYLRNLMKNLPGCSAATKGRDTEEAIDSAKASYYSAAGKVNTIQWVAIILGFIPLALVCGYVIYNLIFNVDSEAFRGIMTSIGKIMGWIVGIGGGIAICAANPIAGIIGGILLYYLTAWLVGLLTPLIPWMLVIVLALVMIGFGMSIFGKRSKSLHDAWGKMDLDTAANLAILGDAFDSRSKVLPDLPDDYPACVYSSTAGNIRDGHRSLIIQVVIMIVIAAAVMALFVWANSSSPRTSAEVAEVVEYPYAAGTYNGQFEGRNATMTLQQGSSADTVEGTIVISYKKKQTHKVYGRFSSDNHNHLILWLLNGDGSVNSTIYYDGYMEAFDSGVQQYSGTYQNTKKGTKIDFYFTQE